MGKMDRPSFTDNDLAVTQGVLEDLADWLEEHQPYATNSIAVIRAAVDEIPSSIDSLMADSED